MASLLYSCRYGSNDKQGEAVFKMGGVVCIKMYLSARSSS